MAALRDWLARAALAAAASLTIVAGGSPAGASGKSAARSSSGMVVTTQRYASDVGAEVLRRGGNAVDAAVAVGYALAVVHPCCGNIGGGGFMVIHTAKGRNTFINFRERAPLAATANMYLDAKGEPDAKKSVDGYLSVGTPGSVAGLEYARKRYGTMGRAALIAPAIRLARGGFVLDTGDVELLGEHTGDFRKDPAAARIFLKAGRPYRTGERLSQPDLARTLALIAKGGEDAFYRGPLAREVVAASRAHGGLLNLDDFAAYAVEERPPVACDYRGRTLLLPPPPSSGGVTICEMFGLLGGYDAALLRPGAAGATHLLTEAARRAYFDRNRLLGDPDFVADPTAKLLSPAYLTALRANIRLDKATPSASLGPVTGVPEHGSTTHYSVVDRWGNAVSVTYTINDGFGAKVVAGRTGFLLNDEMDDFTAKPGVPNQFGLVQGAANAIAPGKRPLSSMAPAIVLDKGRLAYVLGAPGGARIITTVAEILSDILDGGMSPQAAVDAPRWHHQWLPDTVGLEPGTLPATEQAKLTGMGHTVEVMEPWGSENAVELVAATYDARGRMTLQGVNDRRATSGSAAAP